MIKDRRVITNLPYKKHLKEKKKVSMKEMTPDSNLNSKEEIKRLNTVNMQVNIKTTKFFFC